VRARAGESEVSRARAVRAGGAGICTVTVRKDSGTLLKSGILPQIAATGTAWASVTMLVEAGEGIAILPSNLQHAASKNLAFSPLTDRGAEIGLVMAWSQERESPS
jgi:DNA-binding transcriptional LysR family regulator